MNFGFNSNVRSGKALYHVQTEDRGPSHPFLDTVVYEAGRVIYKRSTSYEDFVNSAKTEDISRQMHERIARQHNEVIAELEAGKLQFNDPGKKQTIAASPVASQGLDVRLQNPNAWFANGRVTLEVELLQRNSRAIVADAEVEVFLERETDRTPCLGARSDAAGRATLKFPLPATATDGASLVIRAREGSLYGELRFRLKAKRPKPAPASK